MKKVLLTRYGGMGDLAPVSVQAKQLNKLGYTVDVAVRKDGDIRQTDFFLGCDYINEAFDLIQVGPWANRCVECKHGMISVESIYKNYDLVIDNMFIVENNDKCRSTAVKNPIDFWQSCRNSNWVNWYDLHLAWANINPDNVIPDEKRPQYCLTEKEKIIISDIKSKFKQIIGVHAFASSLARTWYQVKDLIPKLKEKYPDALIITWDVSQNNWVFISNKPGMIKIPINSKIRQSMVMVGLCDLYISVDTGFNHVAEALGIKHITLYSTVPWWTRAKYYKHEIVIDKGIENNKYYTFSLIAGDPLNIQEGIDNLSDREKKLKKMMDEGKPQEEIIKELNTDAHGLSIELEVLSKKIESFARIQSKSLTAVTVDYMMEKVSEVLK